MYYFDMTAGIAGDITLALLAQAYGSLEEVAADLSDLLNIDVKLGLEDVFVNGILCKRLNINISQEPHIHRNFKYIKNLILKSKLDENIKNDSINIFKIIGKAEGKIHGKPLEDVHFHEVGSVDSIIDIVSAAWFYNKLNKPLIHCSEIKIGAGVTDSAHGIIPVPAPATLEIIKDLKFNRIDTNNELTTPTGAAIMKYFSSNFSNSINGKINEVFYATGTKSFKELPNITRLLVIDNSTIDKNNVIIETNIDDMPSEYFEILMTELFEIGCKDVYFTPIIMKKNRPAYKISALAEKNILDKAAKVFIKNSSTFGVRYYFVDRVTMQREIKQIDYCGEKVSLKIGRFEDIEKYSPEYDDVVRVAKKLGKPPYEVYKDILGRK